jgi:hypothetical protein
MNERPEVLVSSSDYIKDIKIRWQIHQYEVNKLVEDVKKLRVFLTPYYHKFIDHVKESYQREFGPKAVQ